MKKSRPITILATVVALAVTGAAGAAVSPRDELPPPPSIEGLPSLPDLPSLPPVDGASDAQAGCVVPDLHGKKVVQAVLALRAVGCELGAVTKTASPRLMRGRVVAQGAAPGTQLAAGTKVAVALGKGKGRTPQGWRCC